MKHLPKRGKVALGMALTQVDRQVRHQAGEMQIMTIGAGTEGTAGMLKHLFTAVFDHRAGPPREQLAIGRR